MKNKKENFENKGNEVRNENNEQKLMKNENENNKNKGNEVRNENNKEEENNFKNSMEESSKCTPNTDSGIRLLKSRKEEVDWNFFERVKKKKLKISDTIKKFQNGLSWSINSNNLSNISLEVVLRFIIKFKAKIIKFIKNQQVMAFARKMRTNQIYHIFLDKYNNLLKRDNYNLNYIRNNIIQNEWIKFDFTSVTNTKSNVK